MKLIPIIMLFIIQLFTYNFARALIWQFAASRKTTRRLIFATAFVFSNGLLILAFTRIFPSLFRINANWLVFLLFIAYTSAIIAILRLICRRFRLPEARLRLIAPLILIAFYATALHNAYTPTVRRISIEIDKPLAQPVRIGMASDTHLGILFGNRQIDQLVDLMNQEKVDAIFLPGDIMDDNTEVYQAQNMAEHLRHLRAPLGVYATIGNHDVGYTGQSQHQSITQALEDIGITVLTNRAVLVNNAFWVVGLPDQLMNEGRQSAAQVLQQTDTHQPIFMLDHRPDSILKHAQLPIDLQVSGHTHNGQIFPANLIVRALNRLHYGYEKIGNGHFVVSSGYGFWGIPLRLASQSEIWIIDVKGKSQTAATAP